jgi:tetratricopeptide (TPR) repeat protein
VLSGSHGSASSSDPGNATLVGRDAELARLDDLLDRALAGSGGVVLLTGEAGVGKTALLKAFFDRARQRETPISLFRARCVDQYGTGEAYLPFLEAAGTLLVGPAREAASKVLRTYAPTWCLQLPALATTPEARSVLERQAIGATKERMLREMGDVFEAAAAMSPILGIIENLQWADRSSFDLLRHLSNRVAHQRQLLLFTFRPADLERPESPLEHFVIDTRVREHCDEIALDPLTRDDVATYLDTCFGSHRLPAELAELIHSRTEGLPLFFTKLVQLMVDRGDIVRRDDAWELARSLEDTRVEAPESVRGTVRRKLETLDEPDRAALQHASVLGREFLSSVLARLLGTDEMALEERLAELSRIHQMVRTLGELELPDGSVATRYRFQHSVYQEVLYESLVSKRRQLLHRRAGEELVRVGGETGRMAGPAARHFEQGRDWPRAVASLVQAGRHAASLFAYQEALDYVDRALTLLDRLPEAERPGARVGIHEVRGAVHLSLNRSDAAADEYESMLAAATDLGQPQLECSALSSLCNVLFFARRVEEMAVRASEALDVAARAGDEKLRLEARIIVGFLLASEGGKELEEAKRLFDDTVAVSRHLGHTHARLDALAARGAVHFWQGEYERGAAALSEAQALAAQLRDGFSLLMVLNLLGLCQAQQGRLSDALRTLQDGLELARRNGDAYWKPRFVNHLGWIHRELQDLDAAIEADQAGLRLAQEHRVRIAEAGAWINLTISYAQAGRCDEAADALTHARAVASGNRWLAWDTDVRLAGAECEVWLSHGELDQAERAGRRMLEVASRHGHKDAVVAHRILAEVHRGRGEGISALEHLDQALEGLTTRPAPLTGWQVHRCRGHVLSGAGEEAAATDAFRSSAAIVGRLCESLDGGPLRERFVRSPAVREVLAGASLEALPVRP